jgi:hypothetical protein
MASLGIQHKRRLAVAIPVTLRNKSWRTAHAPRWPRWSRRCRKDLGESDVKCSKITESILKSFITDHPDAADKTYGFALLRQLAQSVRLRAQLSEGAHRAVAWSPSQSLRRPPRRSRRPCWVAAGDVRAPQIDGRALVRILARSRRDRPPDCAAQSRRELRRDHPRCEGLTKRALGRLQDADAVAFVLRFEDRKRERGARR